MIINQLFKQKKKKMKKSAIIMVMTAAVFTACSNEDLAPALSGEGVEIALRSNTLDASGVLSRAPFVGAIGTGNVLEARVVADDVENFSGTPIANGTMKFNGGLAANYEATGLTGSSQFPDATNAVFLFGVYPASWTVSNGGAAEFTFTGKEDAMAAAKVSTTQNDVATGAYKVLQFKHLLTRLEVKLSAAPAAVTTLGNVSTIKLIADAAGTGNVNNKVSITNNTASQGITFGTSTPAETSLPFYGLSQAVDNSKTYSNTAVSSYTLTGTSTFVGYSMVAPVSATSANTAEYFLEITTAGGAKRIPVDLKSSADADFEGSTAGRSFIVSIYFKSNQEIAVTTEVEPWIEEGEWQGEVAID